MDRRTTIIVTTGAVLAGATLAAGCPTYPPAFCFEHCWVSDHEIEDDDSDNKFDSECKIEGTQTYINPPLMTGGQVSGEACTEDQDEHDAVKRAVELLDACGDLSGNPDVTVYQSFFPNLAADAFSKCEDFLRTQDVDPGTAGTQVCDEDTAETVCDQWVKTPMEVDLGTIPSEPGGKLPIYEAAKTDTFSQCPEFFPELGTGEIGGTGGQCTETADGGDDTTGAMADPPWGDLSNLISCSPQTYCTVERELLNNIQKNWYVFYDDGVSLSYVTISGLGTGVQIDGIDANEDSEELLTDYFGIMNDDVITHVNSVALDSEADLVSVLNAIPLQSGWSITVRRWTGFKWKTLNYYVTLPVSFAP